MIVDSSAIVAIILREPGFEAVLECLEAGGPVAVGAPTLAESALVLSARLGRDARPKLARLLQEYEIEVIPFAAAHSDEATEAFMRFGKGRHPAALNFGDCMSYAVAKLAGQPLLCLGGDFAQTDLVLAPLS
ncbi:MAG: type II toxin-antitoxin system VapC family toxin [Thermoleophilia bacterium]|nr:type II toxin-antitoxin system VapC family toxin [Thermoleophilia bacterium]